MRLSSWRREKGVLAQWARWRKVEGDRGCGREGRGDALGAAVGRGRGGERSDWQGRGLPQWVRQAWGGGGCKGGSQGLQHWKGRRMGLTEEEGGLDAVRGLRQATGEQGMGVRGVAGHYGDTGAEGHGDGVKVGY